MATQRPISTISYNTESFLVEKLNSLYVSHTIQAYMYISHKGEDGDKDHIHLYIEPNKRIDPMDIQDLLKEYVHGSNKPLGVRPFRNSNEENWILYAVHDEDYLALKYQGGESHEKIPYSWKDIRSSPLYDVETAFIRAKASLRHSAPSIVRELQNGTSPLELVKLGESAFVVNAVNRLMYSDDYSNLAKSYDDLQSQYNALYGDFDELKAKYDSLVSLIEKEGYFVTENDTGGIELRRSTLF